MKRKVAIFAIIVCLVVPVAVMANNPGDQAVTDGVIRFFDGFEGVFPPGPVLPPGVVEPPGWANISGDPLDFWERSISGADQTYYTWYNDNTNADGRPDTVTSTTAWRNESGIGINALHDGWGLTVTATPFNEVGGSRTLTNARLRLQYSDIASTNVPAFNTALGAGQFFPSQGNNSGDWGPVNIIGATANVVGGTAPSGSHGVNFRGSLFVPGGVAYEYEYQSIVTWVFTPGAP